MLTSGVILDQYDDTSALVLRSHFSHPSQMPAVFKEASIDPSQLPDEDFALIIQERGHRLRKYAASDPATAAKSTFYFMQCGAKLPLEAQKVAALNLAAALHNFGLKPPRPLACLAKQAQVELSTKKAALPKELLDWAQDRKVNKESSGHGRLASGVRRVVPNPRGKMRYLKTSSVVDTTGQVAPPCQENQAMPENVNMYALVKEGQATYPLDSMDRFLDAMRYFDEHEERFHPDDRRQYCTKVAARADQLGYPVPKRMRDYAATEKSARAVSIALYERSQSVTRDNPLAVALEGLSKEAMVMAPEMLVAIFEEFDKQANLVQYWDKGIPNPVLSVYREKVAYTPEEDDVLFEESGTRMSTRQLKEGLHSGVVKSLLDKTFSFDMANELLESPVSVFNSLPDPHKMQIARIITDNSDGRDRPHRYEQAYVSLFLS
jgi:hypothetical protein